MRKAPRRIDFPFFPFHIVFASITHGVLLLTYLQSWTHSRLDPDVSNSFPTNKSNARHEKEEEEQ